MKTETFNQRYLAFTKPFVDSVKEIYSTMMATEIHQGKALYKREDIGFSHDYLTIMGISGTFTAQDEKHDFRGNLVLSWPLQTYLNTAGAMMQEEYTEINDEIADVGMEICNITMGGAKATLAQVGFSVDMSIPTSVSGNNIDISAQASATTILVPFSSDLGNFNLELNYEEPSEK
ncbi:MAG: chemotaxis protein CheX [Gammaproteobacteria bacterium]|nr:chemotaxis protein CheX [Gammaproteobacteria bacterium]